MDDITRVFIHGLDSSSRGTKGTFFWQRYPEMIREDFSGTLSEKMERLEGLLAGLSRLILVGSSYGGLMASLFAFNNEARIQKLILLAPALVRGDFSPYEAAPLQRPVVLYHGRQDIVVPPDPTYALASRLFGNLDYHLVDDDHDLHQVFPTLDWDTLLEMGGEIPAPSP